MINLRLRGQFQDHPSGCSRQSRPDHRCRRRRASPVERRPAWPVWFSGRRVRRWGQWNASYGPVCATTWPGHYGWSPCRISGWAGRSRPVRETTGKITQPHQTKRSNKMKWKSKIKDQRSKITDQDWELKLYNKHHRTKRGKVKWNCIISQSMVLCCVLSNQSVSVFVLDMLWNTDS